MTREVLAGNAGPPGCFCHGQAAATESKAIPRHKKWLDLNWCVLEFRLARHRIDHRIDQRPDPGIGSELSVPVNRHEHVFARHLARQADPNHATAPARSQPRQFALTHATDECVVRMHVHEWLRDVRGQLGRKASARHGVPMITDTASVQHKGKVITDRMLRQTRRGRHETASLISSLETPVAEGCEGHARC